MQPDGIFVAGAARIGGDAPARADLAVALQTSAKTTLVLPASIASSMFRPYASKHTSPAWIDTQRAVRQAQPQRTVVGSRPSKAPAMRLAVRLAEPISACRSDERRRASGSQDRPRP